MLRANLHYLPLPSFKNDDYYIIHSTGIVAYETDGYLNFPFVELLILFLSKNLLNSNSTLTVATTIHEYPAQATCTYWSPEAWIDRHTKHFLNKIH